MQIPSYTTQRRASFNRTLTPMIGVSLLLLVFFLVTFNVSSMEYVLPSHIQPAAAAKTSQPQPPDFEPLVVTIVWAGDRPGWIISGRAIKEFEQVRTTLESVAHIKPELPVVIDPAINVPLGDVLDVYDLMRTLGFENIQLITSADA